ncbi:MAG: uracil-DNA glycosylase, partial [Phototrophicales bacterium]
FPGEKISRIHGQPRWIEGRMIIPMMHPAAALHQPQYRALIEDDFRRLPEFIAQAETKSAQAAAAVVPDKPDEPEVQQLSLF